MGQGSEEYLDRMVSAIVREVAPVRVVLFGSRARGEEREDSDVDLLVEEDRPFGPERSRWKELGRIRKALSGFRVPKDILVYSSDEVAKWRRARNHMIAQCFRNGRVLYERH